MDHRINGVRWIQYFHSVILNILLSFPFILGPWEISGSGDQPGLQGSWHGTHLQDICDHLPWLRSQRGTSQTQERPCSISGQERSQVKLRNNMPFCLLLSNWGLFRILSKLIGFSPTKRLRDPCLASGFKDNFTLPIDLDTYEIEEKYKKQISEGKKIYLTGK